MWYVYIVECEDGKYYIGMSNNIERRFREHQYKACPESSRRACPESSRRVYPEHSRRSLHFTSYNHATKVLYTEEFSDKHLAAKREKQLKGWTRKKKQALIVGDLKLLKKL